MTDQITMPSGMVRGTETGKPDFTLVDLTMLERWAVHMTAQIDAKGHNNWRLAGSTDDLERFRRSAWRHFVQWMRGDTDEDHAAALMFNIAGVELVRGKLVVAADESDGAADPEPGTQHVGAPCACTGRPAYGCSCGTVSTGAPEVPA